MRIESARPLSQSAMLLRMSELALPGWTYWIRYRTRLLKTCVWCAALMIPVTAMNFSLMGIWDKITVADFSISVLIGLLIYGPIVGLLVAIPKGTKPVLLPPDAEPVRAYLRRYLFRLPLSVAVAGIAGLIGSALPGQISLEILQHPDRSPEDYWIASVVSAAVVWGPLVNLVAAIPKRRRRSRSEAQAIPRSAATPTAADTNPSSGHPDHADEANRPEAGWYTVEGGNLRWWDGKSWTGPAYPKGSVPPKDGP